MLTGNEVGSSCGRDIHSQVSDQMHESKRCLPGSLEAAGLPLLARGRPVEYAPAQ